jgi:hypothetical protein
MKKLIKDRIKVNSAAIKLAEYNYETSELKLTFTNNSEYLYQSVEPFMFEGMRNAESIGRFINKYIKPLTFIKL